MRRRQRRTNAEINEIHGKYMEVRNDFNTTAELSRHLDVSASMVKNWNNGAIPLPDADPKPNAFYSQRAGNSISGDYLSAFDQRLVEDTFDAQELNMSLDEYRASYVSGMQKIRMLIANDATLNQTLRSWLDHDEQQVMDSHF